MIRSTDEMTEAVQEIAGALVQLATEFTGEGTSDALKEIA
jgi:hypothetical protein